MIIDIKILNKNDYYFTLHTLTNGRKSDGTIKILGAFLSICIFCTRELSIQTLSEGG